MDVPDFPLNDNGILFQKVIADGQLALAIVRTEFGNPISNGGGTSICLDARLAATHYTNGEDNRGKNHYFVEIEFGCSSFLDFIFGQESALVPLDLKQFSCFSQEVI